MVGLLFLPTLPLLGFSVLLSGNAEAETAKKLSDVAALLRHEKTTIGTYPLALASIVRYNPLLQNIHKDYRNRELHYERHSSGKGYILISPRPDGNLNTTDDIEH